ncbi:M20 family metallopeptidase [Mycoplasmatota bacterium WC44]
MKDWLRGVREHLHMYPEIGYQEFKTQEILISYLDKLGVTYEKMETGLVVNIGSGEKTILVRADIDGLPITEKNEVPYKSTNENMHACGHDVHMTVALGVIKKYLNSPLDCKLRVVFQPAEEGPGGAEMMISRGAAEGIDYALSLHSDPRFNVGEIGVIYGIRNAICDEVNVKITGKSAHAADPHDGVDAIIVASEFIQSTNYLLSKMIKPFDNVVLQFGKINGGVARNVICKDLVLNGTFRTLSKDVKARVIEKLKNIAKGLETMYDCFIEIELVEMYDLLINNDRVVDLLREVQEDTIVLDIASLGGEDFCFFLNEAPGLMFSLGTSNEQSGLKTHLHSDTFDIDSDSLEVGVDVMYKLISRLIKE